MGDFAWAAGAPERVKDYGGRQRLMAARPSAVRCRKEGF
jgi:hypothetical protein